MNVKTKTHPALSMGAFRRFKLAAALSPNHAGLSSYVEFPT